MSIFILEKFYYPRLLKLQNGFKAPHEWLSCRIYNRITGASEPVSTEEYLSARRAIHNASKIGGDPFYVGMFHQLAKNIVVLSALLTLLMVIELLFPLNIPWGVMIERLDDNDNAVAMSGAMICSFIFVSFYQGWRKLMRQDEELLKNKIILDKGLNPFEYQLSELPRRTTLVMQS